MAFVEKAEVDLSGDLLIHYLGQRICPLCMILQNKTTDLLCKLQFDAVHEEQVNAMVLTAGGYCHYHFWYLEKLASPITNARLLEHLLEKIQKEHLKGTSDGATAFRDAACCPVCCSCKGWEDDLVISFAEKIRQPDFRAAYESSSGLCLPHLSALLKRVSGREERDFLINSGRRQLDALVQDLRLLISKARNKDRSCGTESDASYRAVAKIVGGKNYRAG